jgi:hypothetical protein
VPRCERRGDGVIFGVDGGGQPEGRRLPHTRQQCRVVGGGKIGDAGVRHERLEAQDAALRQLLHVIQVDGSQSTPEGEVDVRAGLGLPPFGVEGRAIESRRVGVERHLGHGGRAAHGTGR